jgi:hypothetical protein
LWGLGIEGENQALMAAGQTLHPMLASLKLSYEEQADMFDVRLFLFCAVLSAHRIKDASPQLRLTFISKLLEPEVESWERTDSRAAPLKDCQTTSE